MVTLLVALDMAKFVELAVSVDFGAADGELLIPNLMLSRGLTVSYELLHLLQLT